MRETEKRYLDENKRICVMTSRRSFLALLAIKLSITVSDYTNNALNVASQGDGSVDQCKEACESETEVSDASVLS
jgi:hypothetical protein